MLFFVSIILSLSLSVFPYVIFCFFFPSPSHSLFYYCDLCSTVGRKQFQKARAEVDLYFLGQTASVIRSGWARNELESAWWKIAWTLTAVTLFFVTAFWFVIHVVILASKIWLNAPSVRQNKAVYRETRDGQWRTTTADCNKWYLPKIVLNELKNDDSSDSWNQILKTLFP